MDIVIRVKHCVLLHRQRVRWKRTKKICALILFPSGGLREASTLDQKLFQMVLLKLFCFIPPFLLNFTVQFTILVFDNLFLCDCFLVFQHLNFIVYISIVIIPSSPTANLILWVFFIFLIEYFVNQVTLFIVIVVDLLYPMVLIHKETKVNKIVVICSCISQNLGGLAKRCQPFQLVCLTS